MLPSATTDLDSHTNRYKHYKKAPTIAVCNEVINGNEVQKCEQISQRLNVVVAHSK